MNRFIILLFLNLATICAMAQMNLDSLLQMVDTTKTDSGAVMLNFNIAKAYRLTNIQKALEYTQRSVQLAEALKDSNLIITTKWYLSSCLIDMGLFSKALDNDIDLVNDAKKLNDSILYSKIISEIGNIYFYQKNYKSALKFYQDAFHYSSARNNAVHAIVINVNMGLTYNFLNKTDSSMLFLRKALDLTRTDSLKNYYFMVLLTIGSRFLDDDLYHPDSAILYLNEVKENETYLPLSRRVSLYNNYAILHMKLHNYEEANNNLRIAKKYAELSNSNYAKRAYLKYKFEFDTLTHNYKNAIESQLQIMQLNDSVFTSEMNDKIVNYQAFYELEKKESEIAILTSKNEIYNLKNNRNSLIFGLLLLVFIFSLIILSIIFRSNRLKNKTIEKLKQLSIEIKSHKEEITALNEELSMNQEKLFEKNKYLENLLEQLKLTQNHLVQSEKITSIGILARGVAYELINPLNFINGGISILQEWQEEDKKLKEITELPLQMMNEGIERALQIAKQLSTFVDQGNTEPQITNINQVIKSTLGFVSHKLDIDIKIIEEYADIDEWKCHPDKIYTITLQLLLNAIDAVKEYSGEKLIKINTEIIQTNSSEQLVIKIYNSGMPISTENLSKLFDPFFTTKDANKGKGLGLTLVYNLVHEQKGQLSVQNLEQGVMFLVTLPAITNS